MRLSEDPIRFDFPANFRRPYLAVSITDFWRRWHISLSTLLRDFLYIPLGGNRRGESRTYINLALVMLLGGLVLITILSIFLPMWNLFSVFSQKM